MGNMSNSSINRWGFNLFWYRYDYNDKIFQLYIQQNVIFNKLIHIYLFFGLIFSKNIFFNKYWYNHNYKFLNVNSLKYNEKFYRKISLKNNFSQEIVTQRFRLKTKFLYYSKIWILKFQKWIIINFYCFQPLNKNKINNNQLNLNYENLFIIKKNNILQIKKIKTFFFYIFFKIINLKKFNYFF